MGIADFKRSDIVALDTNVFIYALNSGSDKGDNARLILESIKKVTPATYISVLVFEEFLVKVYREKAEKNLSVYEDFLTGGGIIRVVDLDRTIARKAANLRSKHKSLRAPDAIHLASAIETKARIFITADKRLPQNIDKLTIKVLT